MASNLEIYEFHLDNNYIITFNSVANKSTRGMLVKEPNMSNFIYQRGSTNDLDKIKQLWEKLNQLHFELSDNFKSSFQNKTWELRKRDLISKSKEILLDYVIDETNTIIGYCISTVDRIDKSIGEIDSLYVEQIYRNSGIGETLMNKAIEWLLSKKTITQRLFVSSGNEQVLSFYEKFGFYPRNIKLERKKKPCS